MRRRLQFWRFSLSGIVWALVATVAVLMCVLYSGADRWWPATLLLFGPRWLLLIPLAIVGIPAAVCHRMLLVPLSLANLLVLGPFMGLQIPFHHAEKTNGKPVVRVLTCNLQNGDFNRQALRYQVEQSRADIVALQECPKEITRVVPSEWYKVTEGDLTVYSRYPIQPGPALKTVQPPHTYPRVNLLTCSVDVDGSNLSFCTVHLPSPRYGIQHLLDRRTLVNAKKSDFMIRETAFRRNISTEAKFMVEILPKPVVIAGDFNFPIESTIYRKDWSSHENAFSKAGFGYGLSEWVVLKGLSFGVRIDHVLLSGGLSTLRCYVGDSIGSDHLPVIAEIVMEK